MFTYEDLLNARDKSETELLNFILSAISDYKASDIYKEATVAYEYFRKRNVTIVEYQKLLYMVTGETVPDNYSANYKLCNGFFPIFVRQENSFLLGNGITFNDNATKDAFGGDEFDNQIYSAGESALWGAVSYVFFNFDHVEYFTSLEFVPLIGEEDGALHAGIRWWQIDSSKPLRATLYEEDGYTDFIWRKSNSFRQVYEGGEILHEKRPYVQTIGTSIADGDEILDGKNYPGFPIVPLWGNKEHQSELIGLREKIDGYDLIQSGLCNTIDDASLIYWTIQNAGGMDDVDLAHFLERMRTVKAAVVDDDGAKAEAHTLDVPYQASETVLLNLRDSLYRDAMALDTDKIISGNVTATAINASYENLELKCDSYEYCVTQCIKALLALVGIDDSPTYHRRKTTNQPEITQMVLSAGDFLDDETILKHLPFLNIDEIDEILARKDKEEASRFAEMEEEVEALKEEQNEQKTQAEQGAVEEEKKTEGEEE